MSRLSLDQLTQAHLDQLYDALDALADIETVLPKSDAKDESLEEDNEVS